MRGGERGRFSSVWFGDRRGFAELGCSGGSGARVGSMGSVGSVGSVGAVGSVGERGARMPGPGSGGRRRWGPATRVLPGYVLAAPSVPMDRFLSASMARHDDRTRGRLRANPGSSRCSLARRPLAPRSGDRRRPAGRSPDAVARTGTRTGTSSGAADLRAVRAVLGPLRSASGRTRARGRAGRWAAPGEWSGGGSRACGPGAGRRRCWFGERGPVDTGSSGRTQGSRADAPSSVRCADTRSVKETWPSGQMGRRARTLGGPASQGPAVRRPPLPGPGARAPRCASVRCSSPRRASGERGRSSAGAASEREAQRTGKGLRPEATKIGQMAKPRRLRMA